MRSQKPIRLHIVSGRTFRQVPAVVRAVLRTSHSFLHAPHLALRHMPMEPSGSTRVNYALHLTPMPMTQLTAFCQMATSAACTRIYARPS